MLASCSLDGTAIVWNVEVMRVKCSIIAVGIRLLLYCHIILRQNGCQAKVLVNSGSGIRVCRWSPDGTKIATAGDDERTTLWDVNNQEELWYMIFTLFACNTSSLTDRKMYPRCILGIPIGSVLEKTPKSHMCLHIMYLHTRIAQQPVAWSYHY